MSKPKFSIITTAHVWHELRQKQLYRCFDSVQTQTFEDAEHVIIDDGSPIDIKYRKNNIPIIWTKQDQMERVIALNNALSMASGEWIIFLDSDDEFMSYALQCMNQVIEANPDYKMFNFSNIYIHRKYRTHIRDAFKPKEKKVGHEVFGGGNIVNGTFLFHRSVYEDLGGYPDDVIKDVDCSEINYGGVRNLHMVNPWDFSAAAQLEFPELRNFFLVDHEDEPDKIIKELGNPWGQDFFLFYKYTRKYHSKPYDIPLLIVHNEGKTNEEGHEIG